MLLERVLSEVRTNLFRLQFDNPKYKNKKSFTWDEFNDGLDWVAPFPKSIWNYFITGLASIIGAINTALYWIRTHTYDKYHLIDCRNEFYDWGYCDPVNLMLYAPMKILVDYIELEKPFNHFLWESKEDLHVCYEMKAIYWWWKFERANEQKALNDMLDIKAKNYKAWAKEQTRLNKKDIDMLVRLVKIKDYMWT